MEQHVAVARGSDIWWPAKLGQPVTISGICPNSSRAMSLTFYSQEGLVDIDDLRQIS